MAIPASVPATAEGYISYLSSQINLADKLWTHYGWAASAAYAKAYESVNTALKKVRVSQEAHRQLDTDRMSFALSLLTVGIGGGVAGAIARSFAVKEFEDAAKQVLQRVQQRAFDPLVAALSPDKRVKGDVFAPADITPEEYTTSLQEGISYNIALLTTILNEVQWGPANAKIDYNKQTIFLKSGGQLTQDEAKHLVEVILGSSFMTNLPPLEVSSEALLPKAKLALWIGWALARDDDYWGDAPRTNKVKNSYYEGADNGKLRNKGDAFWEQWQWESVRLELIQLGVPAHAITAKLLFNGYDNYHWDEQTGLYMWGFMSWASSPAALFYLFDGSLPKDSAGFEAVSKRMSKTMLGPFGWISIHPPPTLH